jgi:hypothetical protein
MPVSDIFREVEEDVRKERLEKFWRGYGDYLIALLVLLILGIGGYELWQRYEDGQRAKASQGFTAAEKLATPAQAYAAYVALSKTSLPSGYATLTKLAEANTLPLQGKVEDAITLYTSIAQSDSGPVGAVARIRAAWLMADDKPRADLEKFLEPINGATSAWREMAREILAYNDYRNGHLLAAEANLDALATDPDSPDALRNRVRAFSAFLHGGGAGNFGTVPPPAPAPAPGMPPGVAPPDAAAPAAAQAAATP